MRKRDNMPDFKFIDLSVDNSLNEILESLDRIALDTEFIREKTFYSQLCLIQISTGKEIFCADPMHLDSPDEDGALEFWHSLKIGRASCRERV